MSKKQSKSIMWFFILTSFAIAFIINAIFKIPGIGIFVAEWEAGDALTYAGSILGSMCTFILGYVAYKQNDRLHKLEEDNFIANNNSMIVINALEVKSKTQNQINLDIHSEQILVDENFNDDINHGFVFSINANKLEGSIPSLIHISSCYIICSENKEEKEHPPIDTVLSAKNNYFGESKLYSRIAVCKDIDKENEIYRFPFTLILSADKRDKLSQIIKSPKNKIIGEFYFEVVTNKFVSTKCKCRCYFDCVQVGEKIKWECKEPQVFFYGNEILDRNAVKICGENYYNENDENV